MKNLSLILNVLLAAAVAHLYYLNFSKKTAPAAEQKIEIPASVQQTGVRIAFVNADTLDSQYTWLKDQKAGLERRFKNAENSLVAKRDQLEKEAMALQEKAAAGNTPRAELEAEYEKIMQRQQKLAEEADRFERQLADDQRKAYNELMSNVETKLKTIQNQIGYDYILSYTRGAGQILLTNDSLDITKQVLQLLNAKEEKK
jgi:outer membrane protein